MNKQKVNDLAAKVMDGREFERKIVRLMREKSPITMFDAVIHYCEKNDVEIETAISLLTEQMKRQIEVEAINENMVQKKGSKLNFEKD